MAKAPIVPKQRVFDLSSIEKLSPKDTSLDDIFPEGFFDLYEVHSYRNAARILHSSSRDDFLELVQQLMAFRINTADVVKPGGNKSNIAKSIEDILHPLGWIEARVSADLLVHKHYVEYENREKKSGLNAGKVLRVGKQARTDYVVEDFIDGHKIDFLKDRVAFDLEWNSKDQTFDRDLYAARTFYECGLINAGILLTRSSDLIPVFNEISSRVSIPQFAAKFGASTTWMGKLTSRLNAGRGGGCPILALGIKPKVIGDFDAWKADHPPIKAAEPINPDELSDEDADDLVEGVPVGEG